MKYMTAYFAQYGPIAVKCYTNGIAYGSNVCGLLDILGNKGAFSFNVPSGRVISD